MLPVVFVPGIFGSYPLPGGNWSFGPAASYYRPFVDALNAAGCDINVCFYDWWKSNKMTAKISLMNKIDEVLKKSGRQKVIIIAHSMGGLVARSYIQSDYYQNNVERLIMLSTPNEGALNAYYPWEGGVLAPSDKDDMVNILFNGFAWIIGRITGKPVNCSLIRKYVPSVKELMPCGDYGYYIYLNDKTKRNFIDYQSIKEKNNFLDGLNGNLPIIRKRGIRVDSICGAGHTTNKYVSVGGLKNDAWPDGKPSGLIRSSEGDGTVLSKSAGLCFTNTVIYTTHGDIMMDALNMLLRDLGLKENRSIKKERHINHISYIIDKKNTKSVLFNKRDISDRFEWGLEFDKSILTLEIPNADRDLACFISNGYGAQDVYIKKGATSQNLININITNKKGSKPIVDIM